MCDRVTLTYLPKSDIYSLSRFSNPSDLLGLTIFLSMLAPTAVRNSNRTSALYHRSEKRTWWLQRTSKVLLVHICRHTFDGHTKGACPLGLIGDFFRHFYRWKESSWRVRGRHNAGCICFRHRSSICQSLKPVFGDASNFLLLNLDRFSLCRLVCQHCPTNAIYLIFSWLTWSFYEPLSIVLCCWLWRLCWTINGHIVNTMLDGYPLG